MPVLTKVLPIWVLLAAAFVFYALGDYFSKKFGTQPSWLLGALVAGFYFMDTLVWLLVLMQRNEIATVGMIFSVLVALAGIFVGIVIFGEKLDLLGWLGIGFGFAAVILLSR
jgi:drug/metabolite transporter (DMT)-like permease